MEHSSVDDIPDSSGLPQHCTELAALLDEARSCREGEDYKALKDSPESCSPNLVWREKVAQWCYDVCDHLDEPRKLVYFAMDILDRYSVLAFSPSSSEREYETAALTALFMAIRIVGNRSLNSSDVTRMSRLGISIREIIAVGKEMTERLSWERRVVTPVEFIHPLVASLESLLCGETCRYIQNTSSFLCEVSVCDCWFSGIAPYKVAAASVLNALEMVPASSLCKPQRGRVLSRLSKLVGFQFESDELSALTLRLNRLFQKSDEDHLPHIVPVDDDSIITNSDLSEPDSSGIPSERTSSGREAPSIIVEEESPENHSQFVLKDRTGSKRSVSPSPERNRPTKRSRGFSKHN